MHWSWVPVWICALSASAQAVDLAPEIITLSRIRLAMASTLGRQPNYTCIQQIERSHRRLPRRKFELHDVLRLEVALVEGKEMFAWPGAHSFEQSDVTEMVSGGAIGTGDFAMHARAVFQTSAPTFKYIGLEEMRGHRTVRFDYVVPLLGSGYRIKAGGREAVVAYHGSFWADAANWELVRLEVNADEIPFELGVRTARDVMDYGRVMIGSSDFLLPVGSELTMTDLGGNESRNRTMFKSCRQYSGESVLTFDEAPSADSPGGPGTAERAPRIKESVQLPVGTALEARLATEIDSANSAIGDPVKATLDHDVKVKHEILLRKGAALSGRVVRLERNGEITTVDLQFSEIESDTSRTTMLARLEELPVPMPGIPVRTMMSPVDGRLHGTGIRLRGERVRLRPGMWLRLRTLAPGTPLSQN